MVIRFVLVVKRLKSWHCGMKMFKGDGSCGACPWRWVEGGTGFRDGLLRGFSLP